MRAGPSRLQLGQAAHGILRDSRGIQLGGDAGSGGGPPEAPRAFGVPLLGHGFSYIRIRAAWRRCGSSDMMASVRWP